VLIPPSRLSRLSVSLVGASAPWLSALSFRHSPVHYSSGLSIDAPSVRLFPSLSDASAQDKASPPVTIPSAAMTRCYGLDRPEAADAALERAVNRVLDECLRTADLACENITGCCGWARGWVRMSPSAAEPRAGAGTGTGTGTGAGAGAGAGARREAGQVRRVCVRESLRKPRIKMGKWPGIETGKWHGTEMGKWQRIVAAYISPVLER
jgi:hypothetical protein